MTTNKFFFDEDPEAKPESKLTWQEHADSFFGTVKVAAGDDGLEKKDIEVLGEMKTFASGILKVEYGTYENNYAIHFTPHHPKWNLKTDGQVDNAVVEVMKIMSKEIPKDLRVNVFLPRKEWALKTFSLVVVDGANAWNFDRAAMEDKTIPECFDIVQKEIVKAQK